MRSTANGLPRGKPVHVKARDARSAMNGTIASDPIPVGDRILIDVRDYRKGNCYRVSIEDVRAFQPGRRVH